MNRYETYGKPLVNNGYDITPLNGKVPIIKAWQTRPEQSQDYGKFDGKNIGVLCGGTHHVIALDIDVKHQPATDEIRRLVEDLGNAPERIGNAPKTLFVFRCTVQVSKVKTGVYDIEGEDACVEILAEGQQFVASGMHPDTKKKYSWPNDSIRDYPADELTEITTDEIRDFIASADAILSNFGELKARSISAEVQRKAPQNTGFQFAENEQTTDIGRLTAAVAYLPNNDIHYDDWVHTAHAIKGAVGDEGKDLFHRWSSRSSKYDATETDRLWDSIENVTSIGAGTIYHMAQQHGFDTTPEENFGPSNLDDGDEPDDWGETEADTAPDSGIPGDVDEDGAFTAASVSGLLLPEREWVLDQWLAYKSVGMLFGAGGIGKTLLMQQLGNCVATGKPFMGVETTKMPTLCVLCEDDELELKRRQQDIDEWMGVDEFGTGPTDCILWPRIGKDNILVTFPQQGDDSPGEFYEQLCRKVEKVKGDAESVFVIADTAADLFGGNENVRREVNTFVKTYLGAICLKYNATIILLAHPSLSGLSSGTGLSGSTAWENSVRSRAYLSRMEDSDEIRILSRKKSNYSEIGNNTDITLMWDKGVMVIPSTPDQMDKLSNKKMKNEILTEIESAWVDGTPYKSNKSTGRTIKSALPKAFPSQKIGTIMKAFKDLEDEGCVVHIERKGYRVEKMK